MAGPLPGGTPNRLRPPSLWTCRLPRYSFDLETMNIELSSSWWPNPVCPKPVLKHFSAPARARNLHFLAIKRQRSTRPLYTYTHVPQAPKCHLGTNPAPLRLKPVIQLPVEGTQRYRVPFSLSLFFPFISLPAKDMLPMSYLHLSGFISQPLALVQAFSDRLKSSLETGVFFR